MLNTAATDKIVTDKTVADKTATDAIATNNSTAADNPAADAGISAAAVDTDKTATDKAAAGNFTDAGNRASAAIAAAAAHSPAAHTPLISVVLPVYNGERYLAEAIASVLAQSHAQLELIVVNDCSTDGSLAIAQRFAAADPRVRIINNERNLKLPASLNAGFAAARGEFLTWTSDDNILRERALERLLDALQAAPGAVMSCSDYEIFNEHSGRSYVAPAEPDLATLLSYARGVGACFLYRSSVPEAIGGYATDWYLAEDFEYWLRIITHFGDGSIVPVREDLYRYRLHDGALSAKCRKEVAHSLQAIQELYAAQNAAQSPVAAAFARAFEIFKEAEGVDGADAAGAGGADGADGAAKMRALCKELAALEFDKERLYRICKHRYDNGAQPIYKRLAAALGLKFAAKSWFWKKKKK